MLTVFHTTTQTAADAIRSGGFMDGVGGYGFDDVEAPISGVFVSLGEPADINEGATGDTVLTIELPEDFPLDDYVIEDEMGVWEAVIPASVLNEVGRITRVDDLWALRDALLEQERGE